LGVSVSDNETRKTIESVYREAGYFLDPHSAVGWKGVDKLQVENKVGQGPVGILCTAHPAKFSGTVEPLTGPVPVPSSIARAMERAVDAKTIPPDYSVFVQALL
ncbi:MAG: threonine synthase, partial [Treponema sp.]|jgi:threonine synthase|nr:threonine synthase [Treponema sp.]